MQELISNPSDHILEYLYLTLNIRGCSPMCRRLSIFGRRVGFFFYLCSFSFGFCVNATVSLARVLLILSLFFYRIITTIGVRSSLYGN